MSAAATRAAGPTARESLGWAAAGLCLSAACVHGSVMVTHFREYWLFGLFFAVVTPLQVAWAEAVRRSPEHVRLLVLGAAGNLAIVAVWVTSRTVGLPFGPDRLQAEGVGVKDVLATLDELSLAAIVAAVVLRAGPRPAPAAVVPLAWTLAAVGLVAALIGGGGH